VSSRVVTRDGRAPVAGAVIHQQELPGGIRLDQDTLDRFLDKPLRIPKNDHDGDEGRVTH
jgi:hypothetical protein